MATPTLQLAVVDNEVMVRRGLTDLVATWPHGRVSLKAANGLEYERACATIPRIHIAIVGLHMPVRDGFETVRWINRHQERTKAVAHAASPTTTEVARLLRNGACGILCKHFMCEEEILQGLDQVRRTGFLYNELVSKALRREVEDEAPALAAVLKAITPREMDFLLLYARPPFPSLLEVADRLSLKPNGVEDLRWSVAKRINCRRREDMIEFLHVQGLR
ncbi:MAG: response regulator transcription factor [Flavobacteriales bacterium]|nr:response regulator transcription factor [Flavobacteriales bacterium]